MMLMQTTAQRRSTRAAASWLSAGAMGKYKQVEGEPGGHDDCCCDGYERQRAAAAALDNALDGGIIELGSYGFRICIEHGFSPEVR
ncbi:hypothetical protein OY671_012732, partial [Metschnikowia pulcherrima]